MPTTAQHREARAQARAVTTTEREAFALCAVAHLESGYGRASYACPADLVGAPRGPRKDYGLTRPTTVAVSDTRNLGAIQAGASWTGDVFWALDSSPQRDGSTRWYAAPYRRYADYRSAWEDLRRIVLDARPSVRAACNAGTWLDVSRALHATRYYEGFGATVDERIARHHQAVALALYLADIAEELTTERPVLRLGARSAAVSELQTLLGGLTVDGSFGPATAKAVKTRQRVEFLAADGIVGQRTWGCLLYR